jgi:adenylate cyclase
MQRKLTAILSADVVGYSGLMEADETGTLERLKANRSAIFDPHVATHGGRIFKLLGDGALVEFSSVVAAVNCALAIQKETERAGVDDAKPIRYRIGINLGDIIIDGDDIYGEGVNVAARLQTLAPVGGIALSKTVRDNVKGKLPCEFDDMGEHTVKNIETPVHVFSVRTAMNGDAEERKVEQTRKLSICVLPFANMSGDAEQEYFSDGISEDIITDLSKISALSVIARYTAFQFKGKSADIPQIARQLKVSHVLEGSVRKSGGRVRITAQLIDGLAGDQVWAERYDRDLNDIFALQDEISEAIVKTLKLKLLPEERKAIRERGTDNLQAYNLYLMARQIYVIGKNTDQHCDAIVSLCVGATKIEPNYARAWALLALAQALFHKATDYGLEAAERAIALDGSLAEAHVAKGRVLFNVKDANGARTEYELALRLDPESLEANLNAGVFYFQQHQYGDAIRVLEKAASLDDANALACYFLLHSYREIGDQEGSRRNAKLLLARALTHLAMEPSDGPALGGLALSLATLGEAKRANEAIDRFMMIYPNKRTWQEDVMLACVLLGEFDRALDLFDPNFAKGSLHHTWITAKIFDPLRDHPRFKEMVAAAEARWAAEETAKQSEGLVI